MDELNALIKTGILPDCLNYTNEKKFDGVDIAKLQYNAFYRSYDFYLHKFPKGFDGLPGFDKVIESIQKQNENNSPLKEIEEIKSTSISDNECRDISDSPVISISE
jgi:hypothetical protein